MNYYYKVVFKTYNHSFKSINDSVDYTKKNVWIYPPSDRNQFLFIFESLEHAIKFKIGHLNWDYVILKIEALGIFSEIPIDKNGMAFIYDVPKGTLFCKAVKVIKEIELYE